MFQSLPATIHNEQYFCIMKKKEKKNISVKYLFVTEQTYYDKI